MRSFARSIFCAAALVASLLAVSPLALAQSSDAFQPAFASPLASAPMESARPPASGFTVNAQPLNASGGAPASGYFMRHLTNNIQGFRLTGEIGQSEWPMYLTEAQTRRKLSFKIGYLAAISVMPEASRLTLTINDSVVGRVNIIGTRGVRTASFDVPQGLLKSGFNSIRISAEQRHRVDCSLKATYELWTQIDPSQTGLLMQRADSGVQTIGDLAALPVDEQGSLPIRAITPARASMGSVERAIRAVQMISLAGRFAQPVVDFGSMAQGDFGLNLAMGPISQLSAQLDGLAIGPVLGPRVVVVPMNNGLRTTVVVTGRDDEEVDEALQQFGVAAAMKGSPEGLRAAAAFPGFRMEGGQRAKLRELGISSQEFSGRLFRAAFNVILPPDFYSADYAKAFLDMAGGYAGGLTKEAQIIVSVNGRNAVNFKLAKSSGEAFKHNPMPLPLGSMRPGLNRIEIEAHLPMVSDVACDPLATVTGAKRFLFLDATEIELPQIARIARMPDLAVTATGAFPYGHGQNRPTLAVLSPTRETVSAAATLAAHLAIAAGRPIDFRLSVTEPGPGEGPSLVIAPAGVVDPALLASVGLAPNDLSKIWRDRIEAQPSAQPEELSRYERQARHRLVLQRNFPATCHMPTPQGGFRNAERRAALLNDGNTVATSEPPATGERDLFAEWDNNLRNQPGFFARVSWVVQAPFAYAAQWVVSARERIYGLLDAPIESPALTRNASLVIAQSIAGSEAAHVKTLLTAPDAATLAQSVACLVDPRVWRQISGGMAVLNMSDAQIIASPAQDTRLISTQPFTLQNARLIAAGWFSLNNKIYVGLALLLGLILAITTSLFVRNVGRRQ
jgi:hypothetical protein